MTPRQPAHAGHGATAVAPVLFSHPDAGEPVDYQRLATADDAGGPSALRTPFAAQPPVPGRRRGRHPERVSRN
ncbi:hypothetical protein [Prauserella muralis]|uniref:Uncharacterized protein n=1 Tax=Prauserella muralis TaxID=588067 RepID=A0A2V4B402_9PSEU|nr:hypothetical protein [Prauserella muralis]PXY28108.1 hypothetical protein BAY60_17370 [Prauserella muralis]TWE22091.1 hypothetical protein FHX69_3324 [Prauserella muralis]